MRSDPTMTGYFDSNFCSDSTIEIRTRFSTILLFICTVLAIVQCQVSLKPADEQFIADFRASCPGFAALYPGGDICKDYVSTFTCSEDGDISSM